MLKMIALITMIIDHIGLYFQIQPFRLIGRLSFPIYCFLINKGIDRTEDVKKYSMRLLVLAIVSQFVFQHIGLGSLINVIFVYFLFVQLATFMKSSNYLISSILLVVIVFVSNYLDYEMYGFIILFMFYYIKDMWVQFFVMFAITMFFVNIGILNMAQYISLLSIFIINRYDKPKYYKKFKKFNILFYWIYPIHLLIIYCFRIGLIS